MLLYWHNKGCWLLEVTLLVSKENFYSFRQYLLQGGKHTNKIVLLRINSTTNLIKVAALLLYNLYTMCMYSWLSNTYNDVCLYEKDTSLIWFWCMGHNKSTTILKSHLIFFLFSLHFRANFLILHSTEDWKVKEHLLKSYVLKKKTVMQPKHVFDPLHL